MITHPCIGLCLTAVQKVMHTHQERERERESHSYQDVKTRQTHQVILHIMVL